MKEKYAKGLLALVLIVGCFGWLAAERPDLLSRIVAAQSDDATPESPEIDAARAAVAQLRALEKEEPNKVNAFAVDEGLAKLNELLEGRGASLFSALTPAAAPTILMETENNDTAANADVIDVSTHPCAVVMGDIDPGDDTDFYSVTVPANSRIWAYVDTGGAQSAGTQSRDSILRLIGTNGTTNIEEDDDDGTGNGLDGTIETDLSSAIAGRLLSSAGTYFLRVRHVAQFSRIKPYKLFVAVTTGTPATESEPNNNANQADVLVTAAQRIAVVSGLLEANGQQDVYSVVAEAGDILYISCDNDPDRDASSIDTFVTLYSTNGTTVLIEADSSGFAGTAAEAFAYQVSAAGTYFVQVKRTGNLGDPDDNYRLMVAACGAAEACDVACPSSISVNAETGQCGATVNFTIPPSQGGCGTVSATPPSGSFFPVGTMTVTVSSGNNTCTFTVTVSDTQAPVFAACPQGITTGTSGGLCSAVVSFTLPTATDNCGGTVDVTATPPSGSTFPKGITTVTVTATDAAGNSSTCTFTVTVNDTTAPQIACPSNIDVNAPVGQCTATVNFTLPAATDNCGGAVTVTSNPASGSSFPVGTTTVTVTATDEAGNTANCTFAVTVNDTTPPSITCPGNIVAETSGGLCSAVVNFALPAGTDNCGGAVNVTANPPSGSVFPKGVSTVTITATDSSNNSSTCTFTVTVNDTTPPSVTCPSNIVRSNDPGVCTAAVTFSINATDNCGMASVVANPASGSAFPQGTTTVLVTATDEAGNTANCTFTVTVNDTTPPQIACPGNIVAGTSSGQCSAAVNFTLPAATDNCGSASVVANPPSGTAFPIGVTTVTLTATDGSGNTSTCSFTVTVNDATAPTLTCPNPITVSTDAGQCSAVVNFTPSATDDCAQNVTIVSAPPSGAAFPTGTTTVTVTVTDVAGNSSTCTFTVTVNDTQAPSLTCPNNIVTGTTGGLCSAVVNFTPAATDNCGAVTVVANPPSGAAFPTGTTTVTVTATDSSGNSTNCSFTVTVNDTTPPQIACPANISVPNAVDQCSAVVTYTFSATDNCGSATVVANPPSGSTFPVGVTTVTVTATDAAGNVSTCAFTVRVNDTQPPVLLCPSLNVVTVSGGAGCAVVNFSMPVALDNCPGVTVTANPPSGSCFPVGTTTIIFTATDAAGNTATTAACPQASGVQISVFDFCLEDGSDPSKVVLVNSKTGDYLFCCNGVQVPGKGQVTRKGNTYTLLHNTTDRMVQVKFDKAVRKGHASLGLPGNTPVCVIRDTDIFNNACACGTPPDAIGQVGRE